MHLCRYLLITVLSLVPWADAIASGSPDLETTALPTAYELSRETLDIPSAYLLLDAEQERAADALFSELRDATAPLRETLRAHRAHVRALLASPTPDDARIGAAMLDIERSNRAIRQAIDATTSAFGELLNAEQRRRWQRYRAATKQGSSLPATDPIYDVRVTSGVVYGRGAVGAPLPGEKNLLLDLYEPISVTSSEPLPTIVLIHGGGFVGGSRTNRNLERIALEMAARGIVAVSIDYRLAPDEPTPSARVQALLDDAIAGAAADDVDQLVASVAAVDDALTAIDWLQANARTLDIAPDRIGILGSSAGAITSVHLAYALDNYGIEEFPFAFAVDLWGGSLIPPTDPQAAADHLEAGEPPLFIVHGTDDRTVPFELSALLVERAREQRVEYEIHPIDGAGHGFGAIDLFTVEVEPGLTIFDRLVAWTGQFLAVGTPVEDCVDEETTACLHRGRFRVTVDYETNTGTTGPAHVMRFGSERAQNVDSAFFWFFAETNFEMGTKILDACDLSGHFWVFVSGLTDQGYTVRIDDTTNGTTWTTRHTPGRLSPTLADTEAFACR